MSDWLRGRNVLLHMTSVWLALVAATLLSPIGVDLLGGQLIYRLLVAAVSATISALALLIALRMERSERRKRARRLAPVVVRACARRDRRG